MEQSDIRVLLTTTDRACSIPDFASLNPGYLLVLGGDGADTAGLRRRRDKGVQAGPTLSFAPIGAPQPFVCKVRPSSRRSSGLPFRSSAGSYNFSSAGPNRRPPGNT